MSIDFSLLFPLIYYSYNFRKVSGLYMYLTRHLGERKEVTLPAGRLRYGDGGEGEPVLFIHGLLTNGNLWRKVVAALGSEFRCIAPDWPMGSHEVPMSPDADLSRSGLAQMVCDFLDSLSLGPVTLVGCDLGGAVAQIVASEQPDRISRLVLLPSGAFSPIAFHYLEAAGDEVLPRPQRGLPPAFGWAAKRPLDVAIADGYLRPSRMSEEVRRDLVKVLRGTTVASVSRDIEWRRQFPRPVLVAWPPEDRMFPYESAVSLAETLPDARLAPIEDSYTYVSEDQPVRLAALMTEFLRETSPATYRAVAEA